MALRDLNRAVKLDSENAQAYFSRGNVYALQKRWTEANKDYEQSLKLNPNNFQIQNEYKNLQQQQATEEINTDEINLKRSQDYNNSGLAHALKQEFTEALADFNQAIALNQKNATIYLNRANVYLEQSQWQQALEDYNQAIKLASQLSHRAYFNRAGIYNMRHQWDKAIADYNMAIKLKSDYSAAYYHRGILNLRQQDWLKAIQDLEQVTKLQPNNDQAYFNCGFGHMKLREWHEAKEKYDQGISINPNDGKAYFNRSIVQANLGNRQQSVEDLQRAKKIFLETGDLSNYQQVEQLLKRESQF